MRTCSGDRQYHSTVQKVEVSVLEPSSAIGYVSLQEPIVPDVFYGFGTPWQTEMSRSLICSLELLPILGFHNAC